jgi:ribonuclease Z
MKPLLHPQMLNDPFGDPVLYIEILWARQALLFDLGELGGMKPAKFLKVSHAFITHTHIDHFVGFDALLRTMLNREKSLQIFGPPGFLSNIRGKLSGYTWNLTAEYPFSIRAFEVHPGKIISQIFRCQNRFTPDEMAEERFTGYLVDEPQFQIQTIHLDHLIPCLAFSLQERFHININKEQLAQMDLPVGPWLQELKKAIWEGKPGAWPIEVFINDEKGKNKNIFPLEILKKAVTITPGQKITYVADCRFSGENAGKIIRLAENADAFYCEAAFLDKDCKRAEERAHLTARQAGELARKAKVKKLHIFHFSPKYEKEAAQLYREAEEAFQG